MEDNKVIMVVVAHPDDPEFGAGGTVAKFVLDGWQAIYVICTNGDKGTSDLTMTSEKLAKIREHEQMNAAKVLGISEVVYLTGSDDPNKFVDVSETFTLRMKAISCHVSQVGNHTDDWESWVKGRREQAISIGKDHGIPLAEVFHRIEIRR